MTLPRVIDGEKKATRHGNQLMHIVVRLRIKIVLKLSLGLATDKTV